MVITYALLFILSCCCVLWLSMSMAQRAYPNDPVKQIMASGVMFPFFASSSVFVLAVFGFLYFFTVPLLLLVSCLLLWMVEKRFPSRGAGLYEINSKFLRVKYLVVFLSMATLFGLFFGAFCYKGTFFRGDCLSYHPAFITGLITQHDISLCSVVYSAHFPFNAEIFACFFVLPFSQDGLAGLSGIYWLALLLIAFLYWGQRHSFKKSVLAFGVSIILLTPIVQQSCKSYAATDIAAPIMIFLAVVFLIPVSNNKNTKRMDYLLSGLCAGFSAGCKMTMFFFVGCIVCAVVLRERKEGTKQLCSSVGLFLLGVFLLGGFPYIRNFWLTGNPLFPASIAFIDGPFGKSQQNATKLLYWLLEDPINREHWKIIFKGYSNWPVPFFFLSLAGYGYAIRSCFSGKKDKKKFTFVEGMTICMGLLFVILYPVIPFSGSPNSPTAPLTLQPRYALFSYLMGMFFLLGGVSKKSKIKTYAFFILIAVINFRYGLRVPKIAFGMAMLVASWLFVELGYRYKERLLNIFSNKKIPIVALAGFLAGFLLFIPKFQTATNERVYNYNHGQMEGVLRALEKLDEGSSLCAFGLDYRIYPLWGRRFQYRPVSVDLNGQLKVYYHRLWKEHPERAEFWNHLSYVFEPMLLIENLRESGVQYVLMSRLKTNDWPQQQDVLNGDAAVTKVYEDTMNCIWDVR